MRYGENYYFICLSGGVLKSTWCNSEMDNKMYNQNNVFGTREEALLESERRALVVRIQRFRDECNASEKQLDWKNFSQDKYFISYDSSNEYLFISNNRVTNNLNLFGHFVTHDSADAAIKMFGSEIKKLFIEVGK